MAKFFAAIALLSFAATPLRALAEENRLVLVAGAHSPLAAMTPAEVRRLYLGIPLTHQGREITAVLNAANDVVKEMFLQQVLFMSAQAYERQVSSRIYRTGGNRIPEVREVRLLLESLAADPLAVSYMPAEMAARQPGVRILGSL